MCNQIIRLSGIILQNMAITMFFFFLSLYKYVKYVFTVFKSNRCCDVCGSAIKVKLNVFSGSKNIYKTQNKNLDISQNNHILDNENVR